MHAVTHDRRGDAIAFALALVALFGASTALTIAPGAAMVRLCSGTAFVWIRAPGQSWLAAEASFLAMWSAMTVAMMLPSLAPTLWRWRGAGAVELGAGYFLVWASVGAVVFPFGVALASVAHEMRALPYVVLVIAGLLQFSGWKARMLACCRATVPPSDTPFLRGVQLGLHCNASCIGATSALLALGMMDLCVMAAVTVAITAERLAPGGVLVARATGGAAIAAGLLLFVQ